MRFNDLKFKPFPYDEQGVQSLVKFGDYEISVVRHNGSYGNASGLYEIGVFKGRDMVELPGVTQDGDTVKGWLTEEMVTGILLKMSALTGENGVQL